MKFKNVFLAMAFVFAIGLSFATERSAVDPSSDYIMTENGLRIIPEITDCGDDEEAECTVQLVPNGPTYEVFDDAALQTPKIGGATIELH